MVRGCSGNTKHVHSTKLLKLLKLDLISFPLRHEVILDIIKFNDHVYN